MGTWGTGVFENDDAIDFLEALNEPDHVEAIGQALSPVVSCGTDYLEAPQAQMAIAAAEIVTLLAGTDRDEACPDSVPDWIFDGAPKPNPDLIDQAKRSIERILTEPSELLELWSESDEFETWKATVESVKARL